MKTKIMALALALVTINASHAMANDYPSETPEQRMDWCKSILFTGMYDDFLTKNCGYRYTNPDIIDAQLKSRDCGEIIDKKMVRQTVDKINGLVKLQMQNITPDQFCEMNHPLAHLRLQLQMIR